MQANFIEEDQGKYLFSAAEFLVARMTSGKVSKRMGILPPPEIITRPVQPFILP